MVCFLVPLVFLLHWLCLAKEEGGRAITAAHISIRWSGMITAQRNISHTCCFPSFSFFYFSIQSTGSPALFLSVHPLPLSSYFYGPYILGGTSRCHLSPWQRLQWDVIGHFIISQERQRQRWWTKKRERERGAGEGRDEQATIWVMCQNSDSNWWMNAIWERIRGRLGGLLIHCVQAQSRVRDGTCRWRAGGLHWCRSLHSGQYVQLEALLNPNGAFTHSRCHTI